MDVVHIFFNIWGSKFGILSVDHSIHMKVNLIWELCDIQSIWFFHKWCSELIHRSVTLYQSIVWLVDSAEFCVETVIIITTDFFLFFDTPIYCDKCDYCFLDFWLLLHYHIDVFCMNRFIVFTSPCTLIVYVSCFFRLSDKTVNSVFWGEGGNMNRKLSAIFSLHSSTAGRRLTYFDKKHFR